MLGRPIVAGFHHDFIFKGFKGWLVDMYQSTNPWWNEIAGNSAANLLSSPNWRRGSHTGLVYNPKIKHVFTPMLIDQPPFTNQCGELPTLKVALRFPVAYGFFSWHCDRRYIHKTTPGSSQGITRIYKNEQHAEDTIKKRCQNLLVPQRVRNLEPHPGWHLPAQRRSSRPNKNGAGCASWKEYLKFRTASPQSILLSLNKGLAIPSHAWEIEKITYLIAAKWGKRNFQRNTILNRVEMQDIPLPCWSSYKVWLKGGG